MLYLEPCEHQLLGWEVGSAELVVSDERPNQTEDQLHISVLDIRVSCTTHYSIQYRLQSVQLSALQLIVVK